METINHKCFVSLEVAKLLKEAGFDWECENFYINPANKIAKLEQVFSGCLMNYNIERDGISAPTLDVAQRWLREVKDCIVLVDWYEKWEFVDAHYGYEVNNEHIDLSNNTDINEFPTYEEALEAGIKKAIKIMLDKGE